MENYLTVIENSDITVWNLAAVRAGLAAYLDKYRNLVYADENIGDAESDKKELNKIKKAIEEARKAYKNQCLAPYDAVEPSIREMTAMIDEVSGSIDREIKAYNELQNELKKAELKKYYDRKAVVLGELAEPLFEKLLDPKWQNKTFKGKESILNAINKARNDLEAIKALRSPYEKTLIEEYINDSSLEAVIKKNEELTAAVEKAGIKTEPLPETPAQLPAKGEKSVTLKLTGSETELNRVLDFLDALGISYERS